MKKVIIQHNFRTGLGDMVSDMSEYMTISSKLKEIGYEIHLIFCLNSNRFVKENIFYKIFDEKTCGFFNSVVETFRPIYNLEYEGAKYHYSSHDPQEPGRHRWDLFLSELPPNEIERVRFSTTEIKSINKVLPPITPKFNRNIIDRVCNFENIMNFDNSVFLHIRLTDSEINNERHLKICKSISSYIVNIKESIYLGTNNTFVYNFFKTNNRVILYDFKTLEYLDNDVNRIDNYNGENVLIERLYDIIAEMVLIKNVSKIYHYSDTSWISNFYFYGLCQKNGDIEINDIKKIIDNI